MPRRRLNVALSDEAIEGWHAFGELTGGNMTALAEVVGIWLGQQARANLSTPIARQLATAARRRTSRRA